MQDKKPFLSIIIPHYNDAARLRLCLNALGKQSYSQEDFEIIVIDNGSSIDLGPIKSSFPKVIFDQEEKPGSYAARNTGIALSKGEILAFLDSDCIPTEQWLKEGVTYLQIDSIIGLVGGGIKFTFRSNYHPNIFELYDSLTGLDQEHYIKNKQFSVTANLFTFRHVFVEVGLFNTMARSTSDMEWGQRVAAKGYRLLYGPDALVYHPARATWAMLLRKILRVAGGQRDSRHMRGVPEPSLLSSLTPPFRKINKYMHDRRIPGIKKKVLFTVLLIMIKWAVAYELIRLHLGGSPKR